MPKGPPGQRAVPLRPPLSSLSGRSGGFLSANPHHGEVLFWGQKLLPTVGAHLLPHPLTLLLNLPLASGAALSQDEIRPQSTSPVRAQAGLLLLLRGGREAAACFPAVFLHLFFLSLGRTHRESQLDI